MITTAQLPATIALAQIALQGVRVGTRLNRVQMQAQQLLSSLTDYPPCADDPWDGVHNMAKVVSDTTDQFGRRIRVVTCTCGQAPLTDTFPR